MNIFFRPRQPLDLTSSAMPGDLGVWQSYASPSRSHDRHGAFPLYCLLILLLAAPLPLMIAFPLTDTTEARYAVIARSMWESQDWITPWFSPGTPFWGKPPLSFWLQALSAGIFGDHAWSYRLPSWFSYVLTVGLIFKTGRTLYSEQLALTASIIYASCALPMISSAAVLTDTILNLGVFLSAASFLIYARGGARIWSGLFFIGLSISLLAKGPLGGVLIFMPLLIAAVLRPKQFVPILKDFPWLPGCVLTALIVLPWYIAAEIKTPGFLHYFLWGEHVLRFVDPGWQGDLYGTAHKRPLGTMLFYAVVATAPWSLIIPAAMLWQHGRAKRRGGQPMLMGRGAGRGFEIYLAAGVLVPILFFCLCANVLWTYALPAVPAFSLLSAWYLARIQSQGLRWVAPLVATVAIAGPSLFGTSPDKLKTEEGLIAYAGSLDRHAPVFYWDEVPFSGRYYSHERSTHWRAEELEKLKGIKGGADAFLAVPIAQLQAVQQYLAQHIAPGQQVILTGYSNHRYNLLEIKSQQTESAPAASGRVAWQQ